METLQELERRELKLREDLLHRQAARFSFEQYCTYVDPRYQVIATQWARNIHRDLIEILEDVEKWIIKRLRISCPARLGKTRLWGINFPSWYLWRHPDKSFVLASYSANMAVKFSKDTRRMAMSDRYKSVFPNFQMANDQGAKWDWETIQWWGMYAVGVEWGLTWRWWNVLYIDDPVKDMKDAQSPVVQEATVDRYESVLSTRKQDENSAIVLTMTRWDLHDLAWYLENKEKEWWDRFVKFTIKAIDENDHPIIWPGKRWPTYFFKEREIRSHKVWTALYQQDPTDMSWALFKPGEERYFLESDFEKEGGILKKSDFNLGLIVDPAFSSNIKSDDIVLMMVGQHKLTKDIYVFDIWAETKAPTVSRRQMFFLLKKWIMNGFNKPFVSIEQVDINKDQTAFYKNRCKDMEDLSEFYTTYQYRPKVDKAQRIVDEIEPMWTANKVYFNKNIPQEVLKETMDQIFKFPNVKHDDRIDCLAQAIAQFHKLKLIDPREENRARNKKEEIMYDPVTNEVISWQR